MYTFLGSKRMSNYFSHFPQFSFMIRTKFFLPCFSYGSWYHFIILFAFFLFFFSSSQKLNLMHMLPARLPHPVNPLVKFNPNISYSWLYILNTSFLSFYLLLLLCCTSLSCLHLHHVKRNIISLCIIKKNILYSYPFTTMVSYMDLFNLSCVQLYDPWEFWILYCTFALLWITKELIYQKRKYISHA